MTTFRLVAAGLGAALATAVVVAAPAAADEPGYYGFYGLASEYPPGTCIDVPNSIEIDVDLLKNLRPVSCDDGFRDLRVVAQASMPQKCIRPIDTVYVTTDGQYLCTVSDYT